MLVREGTSEAWYSGTQRQSQHRTNEGKRMRLRAEADLPEPSPHLPLGLF